MQMLNFFISTNQIPLISVGATNPAGCLVTSLEITDQRAKVGM